MILIIVIAFIVIAGALTWFLLSHDRGEKEPISALWIAAGFGFLGAVMAGAIENFVIPIHLIDGSGQALGLVLVATLGVGCIEEACKFLPLAFFIYRKPYFNEHTDGIIYFVIAGLAFGVPENILYSLQFGAGVGLARIILTPLFHAATTSMVGYFLAKSKVEHQSLVKPALALVGAMLLHGFYDFGLSSKNGLLVVMSLMITIGMSAVLFLLFMRANERDRAQGLSAVGHNSFCRTCGYPNPDHKLYCTRCGQHA
jgi:protease PrsW